MVHFGKDDRKIDVMRPYLAAQAGERAARCGRDGMAQNSPRVFLATKHTGDTERAVLVHQGRPAGDLLLLLCLGRRFRAGVCEGVRLLPVPDQGLDQLRFSTACNKAFTS